VFYHVEAPFAKSWHFNIGMIMEEPNIDPNAHELDERRDEPAPTPRFNTFLPWFKSRGGIAALQFLPFYLAGGIVLFLFLWIVTSYLLPPRFPRLWGDLIGRAIFAVAAIAPAVGIAAIEGRPFGDYGLPERQAFGKLFWSGALWGVAALSVLLFVMHALGEFSYGGLALHGVRIWKFAAFWAVFFLLVALFEEFTFRGYPQFVITQFAGFWPSALLLSAIFGYTHLSNRGETWVGAFGAAAIGLFFCFTLRRTGTLWFAVGMHASWDWGQSFLYGVPDSGALEPGHLLQASFHGSRWLTGGMVGPEGSVLMFVLIGLMWVVFDRMYPAEVSSPLQT